MGGLIPLNEQYNPDKSDSSSPDGYGCQRCIRNGWTYIVPEDAWHKEIPKGRNYVGVCCERLDGNCSLWQEPEVIETDEDEEETSEDTSTDTSEETTTDDSETQTKEKEEPTGFLTPGWSASSLLFKSVDMAVAACPFKEERCFRPIHGKVASRCDENNQLTCTCPTGLEKIDFRRISEARKYGLYAYGKNEEYYSNTDYWRSLDCIHRNF